MTKAPKLLLRGRLKLWPSFRGRKMARPVFKDVERLNAAETVGAPGPSQTER